MKYLFVVTYGRSGSTALQNVLNAIDGYCIRGENMGAWGHISAAVALVHHAMEVRAGRIMGPNHPWYGIDKVDVAGFGQTLVEAFVEKVLVPPDDARVIGFKEIRYTADDMSDDLFDKTISFMLTAFGDARIIFNMRDWRQVARSAWWLERRASDVRETVRVCDERFRRAHDRYPDRTFMINHREYDGNPDGFLPLLAWLGESLDEECLQEIGGQRLTHLQMSRRNAGLIGRLKQSRLGSRLHQLKVWLRP